MGSTIAHTHPRAHAPAGTRTHAHMRAHARDRTPSHPRAHTPHQPTPTRTTTTQPHTHTHTTAPPNTPPAHNHHTLATILQILSHNNPNNHNLLISSHLFSLLLTSSQIFSNRCRAHGLMSHNYLLCQLQNRWMRKPRIVRRRRRSPQQAQAPPIATPPRRPSAQSPMRRASIALSAAYRAQNRAQNRHSNYRLAVNQRKTAA